MTEEDSVRKIYLAN